MARQLTMERRLKIEERRKEVARLLKAGYTLREIADSLLMNNWFDGETGISLGTVFSDAKVILDRIKKEGMLEYSYMIALENARIDEALKAIWEMVLEGNLGAIDRFIKLSERRAKLLGLDVSYYSFIDPSSLSDEEIEAVVQGKPLLPGTFRNGPLKLFN